MPIFFLQNESIRLKWIGESIRIANRNALVLCTHYTINSLRRPRGKKCQFLFDILCCMLGDFFVYVVKDVENNVFLLKMHLLGIQLTVSLTTSENLCYEQCYCSYVVMSTGSKVLLYLPKHTTSLRLFACHDPPPPLAWYSTRRFADYSAWQDKSLWHTVQT